MSVLGCVGQPETKRFTEPLAVTLDDNTVTHEFLFLPECGLSICGRDLMCKLSLSIVCTPDGHRVLRKHETIHMLRDMKRDVEILYLSPDTVNDLKSQATIYWAEVLTDPLKGNLAHSLWQQYKIWAKSVYPLWETLDPLHVTLLYTTLEDDVYEEYWRRVDGQTFHISYTCLYLGPTGMAIEAILPEELKPFYRGEGSVPHVSLAVTKHHSPKELGPMVKLASTLPYDSTERDGVFFNKQHGMFKIILPQGSEELTRTAKVYRRRVFENHPDTDKYLSMVPESIWMTHPNDVGETDHVVKVQLTTDKPIYCKQYPLKEDQKAGIQETIDGLLASGVIYETVSDYNTPLFPVKKSDLQNWRMTQDFRRLNEITAGESYPVPDPYIALNNLSPSHKYFTVIDLANAFFTIKIHPDSQKYFAFNFNGKIFSYRRMCQGWRLSPSYFNMFLREDLADLDLPDGCVLIQYVDDLLLGGEDAESVLKATVVLLTRLAEKGYKVKRQKIQVARESVYFLGREVYNGAKSVTEDNRDAILTHPQPETVRQMLSFLGLCNYSREYIPAFTEMTTPLRDLIKPHGMHSPQAKLTWTAEAEEAFVKTKQAICTASALYAPDYTAQFHLDVAEKASFVQAVLYQKQNGTRRVLKHYSCMLDAHDQAQPGCARYLAALTKTIDKTAHIVQNHPLVIHTDHGILAYLNSHLFITTAARSNNIMRALRQPHITYETGTINMARNMETEGRPHTCEEKVKTELYVRADLQTTPLDEPDMVLFCDGCSFRADDGHIASAYAVVQQLPDNQHKVLAANKLTSGSAQVAELTAMLRALQLAEGNAANIYTDSVYAYKTVTLSLAGWIRNGFKLTSGKPVKHENLAKRLVEAIHLPERVAIMKCKAHTKHQDSVSMGNQAADDACKEAAGYKAKNMLVQTCEESNDSDRVVDSDYVKQLQESAGAYEHSTWKARGASKDDKGLWRNHEGKLLAPATLLRMLFDEYHTPTHRSYEAMRKYIDLWYHPHMKPIIQYWIDECHICQTMTPKRACRPPPGTFTLPNRPFERIVMDFTDMGPEMRTSNKRYLLVLVDEYSKWPEAYACKTETAKEVVKHLVTDVFPRFGVPHVIRTDNGSHFTAKIVKDVLKALNITQKFGNIYHAPSQGVCERMNATIKRKLAKVWQTAKIDWVTALPFVLMDIRNSVNRTTSFTPHMLLTGREMQKPMGPFNEDSPFIEWDKQHHQYVQNLQKIVLQLHKCRQRAHNEIIVEEPDMTISPGMWVYVKVHRRSNWTQPYQTGPYLVLQSTGRSVQIQRENSKVWYHLSHCFKSPTDPTHRRLSQVQADLANTSPGPAQGDVEAEIENNHANAEEGQEASPDLPHPGESGTRRSRRRRGRKDKK